jgi:hypothetical protein
MNVAIIGIELNSTPTGLVSPITCHHGFHPRLFTFNPYRGYFFSTTDHRNERMGAVVFQASWHHPPINPSIHGIQSPTTQSHRPN